MSVSDEQARRLIREDLDTTFVVEAAAGTGKTTELIARMVAIIRSGRAQLGQMVALTFTEKAAGEMKLRLRSKLEEGVLKGGDPALEQALAELETANISTIHAFCADTLREHPIEARVDPRFELVDEAVGGDLMTSAFNRWFEGVLADPPEGVRRFLRRSSTSHRKDLLRTVNQLAERRDHPSAYKRPDFDRETETDALLERVGTLMSYLKLARSQSDYLVRNLREIDRWYESIREREKVRPRDYDSLEGELPALLRIWGAWRNAGRGKFSETVERSTVLEARDALKEALTLFGERADADLAAALQEALAPVVNEYEGLKDRSGRLDFLDLLLRMRDLLAHSTQVRGELQSRYRYIFVDEFQDTDPAQGEILSFLSKNEQGKPAPGKLFVVGDPKQAIYRFRRADIATYHRIRKQLLSEGAQLIHLSRSFRAVPTIQKAINLGFSAAMAESGAHQADYVALTPVRDDWHTQPAVVALPVPAPYGGTGNVTRGAVKASTPRVVGAFIEWLVSKSGYKVTDVALGGSVVPVEARHVCLLFRNMNGWDGDQTRAYVRELQGRKIPHVLVGGSSFFEREEVNALRMVLSAIEYPSDPFSVYAALRGPFFAHSDESLFLYKQTHKTLSPLRPAQAGSGIEEVGEEHEEVHASLTMLREFHYKRNHRPIAATMNAVLDELRVHAAVAIWPTGEQALANLLRLVNDARRFDTAEASSFRSFLDWMDEEQSRGAKGQAPATEEESEGVRVMTVHGAKGLEYPIVVLCDPTPRRERTYPSRFVDHDRKLWAASICKMAPQDLLDHAKDVLIADGAEEVRIAYVAATRARDMLVVPVVGDGPFEGWLDPLNEALYPTKSEWRHSERAEGCPTFGEDSIAKRNPRTRSTAEETVRPGLHRSKGVEVVWWDPNALNLNAPSVGGIHQSHILGKRDQLGLVEEQSMTDYRVWQTAREELRAKGSVRARVRKTVTELAHEEDMDLGAAVQIEVVKVPNRASDRPRGKRFGTLVHGLLNEERAQAVQPTACVLGRLIGATEAETEAAVAAALAAHSHEILQRARASDDCRRETHMTLRLDDGTVAEGIIDLAFREGDEWTVVDFKTDAEVEGSEHAVAYKRQVGLYVAAIKRATGQEARGVLLLV